MKKFLVFLVVVGLSVGAYFWVRANYNPKKNAVTNYTDNLRQDRQKAVSVMSENNLSIVKQALSSYYSTKQSYPAALDDLVKEGFLTNLPAGNFSYNSATGEVTAQ